MSSGPGTTPPADTSIRSAARIHSGVSYKYLSPLSRMVQQSNGNNRISSILDWRPARELRCRAGVYKTKEWSFDDEKDSPQRLHRVADLFGRARSATEPPLWCSTDLDQATGSDRSPERTPP